MPREVASCPVWLVQELTPGVALPGRSGARFPYLWMGRAAAMPHSPHPPPRPRKQVLPGHSGHLGRWSPSLEPIPSLQGIPWEQNSWGLRVLVHQTHPQPFLSSPGQDSQICNPHCAPGLPVGTCRMLGEPQSSISSSFPQALGGGVSSLTSRSPMFLHL